MYENSFYIEKKVGNNELSFDLRQNKKLFVPKLIEIKNFDEIIIGDEIVFEDYDFDNKLISAKGLKNFYKFYWNNIEVYLFDNHNHAFYFWYLAKNNNLIQENSLLFHIDEHSDMRKPKNIIEKSNLNDLEKIFDYTNFELNVGNYIIPALENNLFSDVVQIRDTKSLLDYDFNKIYSNDIVLNLDLDFFEPNLDFIDYELKKEVILDIAEKSKLITIATSPFFIDQKLALKVFFDLFGK
ncbi:UPF0489 family protein [Candidatus Gracilibacteria bacterium]|nr:UPF0489 family protein [Candidatus Gracilibacteria bacterium]